MANKTNYTPETILNINFAPDGKGYNPLEVDQTLDAIIEDYKVFEKEIKTATDLNIKLDKDLKDLKDKVDKLEIENAKMKKSLAALPKDGINQDNYQLMRKVKAYERVLYKKGIDLKKALSDPDNC